MIKETLPGNLIELIERLHFETISRINIVTTLISGNTNKDMINSDLFYKYEKDYISKFMEYDLAKQTISNHLISKHDPETTIINWSIPNFSTKEVEVEIMKVKSQYNNIISVDVDEDELAILANLYYTTEARRNIISTMFDTLKLDPSASKIIESDAFMEYQSQLIDVEKRYEIEKSRLSNELINTHYPILLSAHDYDWKFDFMEDRFIIYIKCDCGVH